MADWRSPRSQGSLRSNNKASWVSPIRRSASPLRLRYGSLGWATVLLALLAPAPVSAQFGPLEALVSKFSDVSFFGGVGQLFPLAPAVASGKTTVSFGVELLLEVTSVSRPVPGAPTPEPTDSVAITWTRMDVVRSEEGVDTVYYYDVEALPPPSPPMEKIWGVEMGIGYGQFAGLDLADSNLQLRGSIRDLPAATIYASYEPWSTYVGLRTGFMKTKSLQVFDKITGERYSGDAEAFLAGLLVGHSWGIGGFWAFSEVAYTSRYFPSVDWGKGNLPEGIPTDLQASGWSVTAGIQFPIR